MIRYAETGFRVQPGSELDPKPVGSTRPIPQPNIDIKRVLSSFTIPRRTWTKKTTHGPIDARRLTATELALERASEIKNCARTGSKKPIEDNSQTITAPRPQQLPSPAIDSTITSALFSTDASPNPQGTPEAGLPSSTAPPKLGRATGKEKGKRKQTNKAERAVAGERRGPTARSIRGCD